MSKRRIYIKEFKMESVQLSYKSSKSVKEIASELGIPYSVLCKWRSVYNNEKPEDRFRGHGKVKPSERKYIELEKELSELKEEREILKKTLTIFSTSPNRNIIS